MLVDLFDTHEQQKNGEDAKKGEERGEVTRCDTTLLRRRVE